MTRRQILRGLIGAACVAPGVTAIAAATNERPQLVVRSMPEPVLKVKRYVAQEFALGFTVSTMTLYGNPHFVQRLMRQLEESTFASLEMIARAGGRGIRQSSHAWVDNLEGMAYRTAKVRAWMPEGHVLEPRSIEEALAAEWYTVMAHQPMDGRYSTPLTEPLPWLA